jgi:hypothetical protein
MGGYPESRTIAGSSPRQMRSERTPHTWQPTVLVNELYLELLKIRAIKTGEDTPDREAFLGLAAHIMRRLLIAELVPAEPGRFAEFLFSHRNILCRSIS